MKANAFYISVRDKGLTLEEAERLTCEEVSEHVNEQIDLGLFENLKGTLIEEIKREQCQTILQNIESQLVGGNRVWLKDNFPESEFGIDAKRRIVHIYLDGKEVNEEDQ